MSEQHEEIAMVENNAPSLDEMLKAIPKLSAPDLEKLRGAAMDECTKRKLSITQFEERLYENPGIHRGRKPK
jgi:uncharacterized lipoprotein YehR (DUF1307 family)